MFEGYMFVGRKPDIEHWIFLARHKLPTSMDFASTNTNDTLFSSATIMDKANNG